MLRSLILDPMAIRGRLAEPPLAEVPGGTSAPTGAAALRWSVAISRGLPSSVLVTSSRAGEGKSTCALDLAIAMAGNGKRVILVDADLRRGELAERLSLQAVHGFSDFLRNERSWRESVQVTGIQGLDLLPRGRFINDPEEMLRAAPLGSLMDELHAAYDQIVLDAPPALAVSDLRWLAPLVGGCVLVVREGRSTARERRGSVKRLFAYDAKLLGWINNRG